MYTVHRSRQQPLSDAIEPEKLSQASETLVQQGKSVRNNPAPPCCDAQ
jgi:hypothetical protein